MSAPDLAQMCHQAVAFHQSARARLDALAPEVRENAQGVRLTAPWDHFERGVRGHFAEEEEVLFPALRAAAAGEAPVGDAWRGLLREMERELDEVRTIADALRNAARDAGPLERDLLDLLDDLEEHARIEEEVLLPAARRVLGPAPAPAPQAAPAPKPRVGILRRTARRLRDLVGGQPS